MRIQFLSDVHLEFAPCAPAATGADLVVLAGDIHNGAAGIEWARERFASPVLYVAGNHEYYEGDLPVVHHALAAAARRTGVRLLDCGERRIAHARFLGCTLWSDYSLVPAGARARVIETSRAKNPDYALIRNGARAFSPEDSIALCARHRRWLAERLAEPFSGPTVVITHFAPHPLSIAPAYADHPANPAFIVPLEQLMGRAALWIHGHTHTRFDYDVRGTRVVCNPRGYPGEATGFRPDWTIDL
ncbi:MAG: metallophosphoesterase family protein [Burkholderiales bacterium]|nr:metallophosphoesterase family protein [Burkholderiales bacterium]